MITLGVDPGTATTGFGLVREQESRLVLVECGVITTPPGDALPLRLRAIYEGLAGLVREFRPDAAAVEELFFSRNARTALAVGHARGVALLALADGGLPIAEYKPVQVKQAIAGYGRADKKQVQEMVRLLLDLDQVPQPDDAADALAIAICHIHSARMVELIASPG